MYQSKKYVIKYTKFSDSKYDSGSKKGSESLKQMKNNEKIKNIPIGHYHQNKQVKESSQCYQQKKPVIPSKIENIPIGECIHCHQNKPVKLGECLQCYQQKKQITPSKRECIHCHQTKPVKLGECLQCHQQKKQATPSKTENIPIGKCIHYHQNKPVKQCYQQKKTCLAPSEQMNNNEKAKNIGECIHCYQEKSIKLGECYICHQKRSNKFYSNKKECPECKKRITDMNRMINDKICSRCHTKYQRRFDNFNNQIACKTCNEQNQKREMYNENGQWFCSLDCMYAKKILDEIGDMKNINKERINILVNRFTSTNKNAGSTYNLTSKMIMEKIEISMKQNKSNIENVFDEIKKTPDYTIMYNL
ncbi:18904_t:CDS:1 [Rhizophagus irregularis]|nr:18904_t:CDS:1 [Rhizophagus irregularis]